MIKQFAAQHRAFCAQMRAEFTAHIADLLEQPEVRRLDTQKQHYKFTRLRHTMDVAYRSYFLSRFFGWRHSRSVARAALLHDFFFLEEGMNSMTLYSSHPKIAVENASKITELSPMERDIIEKHMFFCHFQKPNYKESVLVIAMDNVSCLSELIRSFFSRKKVIAALEQTEKLCGQPALLPQHVGSKDLPLRG